MSAILEAQIMPLSEVKPGLRGTGKSVFAGNKIEDFQVEILGVIENNQPKRNWILARLSGQGLENTGVVAGMSGSPVYIDGKLVGAVAFSYAFAKEAIAGITPIEEMLEIQQKVSEPRLASAPANFLLSEIPSQEQLGRFYLELSRRQFQQTALDRALTPLRLPLIFTGFSEKSVEEARNFFDPLAFHPVLGGGVASPQKINLNLNPTAPKLSPGEAVGIQLIAGDLDLTAVGTVTQVEGNRVLALGHPFYNLGPVDYGLTRVQVLTVVPSLESSFKMAAMGELIGRVTQDRTSGVAGELGVFPKYIPVSLELQQSPVKKKQFKLKIVNDPILTPALLNLGISSLVSAEERSYGNLSLDFEGDIILDQGQAVHVEDLFSGNYNNPTTDLSGLVAAVVYLLKNNEFQEVKINTIDLKVRAVDQMRNATLEKVLLDKYEVNPGEIIRVAVYFRTSRNEVKKEEVEFMAPALPPGTEFNLVVGDAVSMQQLEKGMYRLQDFTPRNFNQLLRLLSNLRKNNRIYFKIMASKPGLFLRGEEMPNLPPSLKMMFTSPRAATTNQAEIDRSTLGEYQLPIPYVFKGSVSIPIKIKK
ncbi:MAG: SpoIVB peptidase S55 domain-containing protein [Candidatus Saccharicenans sp.]